MNKSTGTVLFFALVSSSLAFQIQPRLTTSSKHFTTQSPFHEIDINLDQAQDCASNFGKCSVDEVEHFRDELHAHRVQAVAFGADATPDIFTERFLEMKLSLQLDLLKQDRVKMDNGLLAVDLPPRQDAEASDTKIIQNKQMMLWKELSEDGALESLAICGMLGLMMMAPKFF